MIYSSSNGCLFYYDRVLFSWKIAEPTMLFLLGLEAVTSFNKSASDTLTLSKYAYYTNGSDIEPLDCINEVYNDIYSFLSYTGSVEDFENYIKYNCYGLKLLLNELTGMTDDRTIPIIFKNDSNKSLINLSKKMYRISESEYTKKTQLDLQAQKIHDIFEDADYSDSVDLLPTPDKGSMSDDEYSELLKAVSHYNTNQNNIQSEKELNNSIYTLLDYKAMYAYSLGVLYGCLCLGYDYDSVWRISPKSWYTGEYTNLVNTAWYTVRFHFTHFIDDESVADKYKSIQSNKIWNFTNEPKDNFVPLEKDEQLLYGLSVKNDHRTIYIDAVNYSYLKYNDPPDPENSSGYYLADISGTNPQWKPISDKISSTETMVGFVSDKDQIITRYLADVPVYIRRAYCYYKDEEDHTNDKYLAPDSILRRHFMITGSVGWTSFDESGADIGNNTLSLTPCKVKNTDIFILLRDRQTNKLVISYPSNRAEPYWEILISTLYGIFETDVSISEGIAQVTDGAKFNKIVSLDYAMDNYDKILEISGYTLTPYYNVDKVLYLYVDETNTYLYDSSEDRDESNYSLISYYGYTENPSTPLEAYNGFNPDYHTPIKIDLRYIENSPDDIQYWSSTWQTENDNKHTAAIWRSSLDVSEKDDIYIKSGVTSLYKGAELLANSIPTYAKSVIETPNYIFNDCSEELSFIAEYNEGFIYISNPDSNISDLYYSLGITPYECSIILQDDNGNCLTSDGTPTGIPLVWYDNITLNTDKYWNGFISKWQENKPIASV